MPLRGTLNHFRRKYRTYYLLLFTYYLDKPSQSASADNSPIGRAKFSHPLRLAFARYLPLNTRGGFNAGGQCPPLQEVQVHSCRRGGHWPPVSVRCVPFFGRAMPAPTIAALHSESIRRISPCKAGFTERRSEHKQKNARFSPHAVSILTYSSSKFKSLLFVYYFAQFRFSFAAV